MSTQNQGANPAFIPSAFPTPRQLEFQNWELSLFCHFGIRTFYEGYRDFDGRTMLATEFKPTELDCSRWCRTARDAGFKSVVMTAKHHDGFCLWPSKHTTFSVAASPWKDGKGDVISEFRDACAQFGLNFGVYYSPFDADNPVYDDPGDYFINQLSELLTNYGKVDILWLDGCGSENHQYDWSGIVKTIRRLQPEILLFHMGDPDFRWVGNEDGLAPLPLWNTATELIGSTLSRDAKILSGPQWLPAECDVRMRDVNWFYSDSDEHTVKSLDELMAMYYYSVGRGANLLLNIGPDRRGLLPELDAKRLLEFGNEIRRRFAKPFVRLSDFKQEGKIWTYDSPSSFLIDHLIVQEDLKGGENVRRFRIEILTAFHGAPITVWEGHNIGHKAICHFPIVRAHAIRLTVIESDAQPVLRSIYGYAAKSLPANIKRPSMLSP
jgi:alpha-L-fucosidase